MKKIILLITILILTASVSITINAQTTKKKADEKPQTTTIDAWRQALPGIEMTSDNQPAVGTYETEVEAGNKESPVEIEKTILGLERDLIEAFKKKDAGKLSYLLADDVVIADSQLDKTQYINWVSEKLNLKSYKVEKTVVRVYPTTAVVTIHFKRQALIDNVAADGNFVVTDVWVKNGDLWQVVSHHTSELPKS